MDLTLLVPPVVFVGALIVIAFEVFEKSLVALLAAIILILAGYISPDEALLAVNFQTIVLLMAMMMLVEIARETGIFSWLNIKLVSFTRGNPLLIGIIFSVMTAFLSAFLGNVSTIIIVVPITIALLKGLGRDPKPLVLQEILMANMGGSLTLIGDPTNIILAGKAGLVFNQFIINLWVPVLAASISLLSIFIVLHWKHLRPIADDLKNLFLSMTLIKKLEYKFLKIELNKGFVFRTIAVLLLTLFGFVFQSQIGLPAFAVAMSGAVILAFTSSKEIHIHKMLHAVEWSTLLFFSGLFMMVAAVEKTGILDYVSEFIAHASTNFGVVVLLILWISAFISMILDNVAFVTIMVPVIIGIREQLPNEPHLDLLWWALSLGAVMGGSGTLIGASSNVMGCELARKDGVKITFMGYMRYAFPMTIIAITLASAYLLYRVNFT